MKKHLQTGLGIILSFCMASPNVFAVYGGEITSARTFGQGESGISGQNEDPIAVYTQPAAIGFLKGTQVTGGMGWLNLHGGFESDSGNKVHLRSIDAAIPNLAVTHALMDGQWGLGLAVVAPYSVESHWPGDSQMRYVTTNSRFLNYIVAPGASYQVTPEISVGVGADFLNLFNMALEKNIFMAGINDVADDFTVNGSGTPGSDGIGKLSGSGTGWGFHGGAVYQPNSRHAFGITYHSKVKVAVKGALDYRGLSGASATLFGGSNYSTDVKTDVFFPQNIHVGYGYKPTEKWLLEADLSWIDWYSTRDYNLRLSETNPSRLAIITNNGAGNPLPATWSSTLNAQTGANYKYSDKLQLRGGFNYQPHSSPEFAYHPGFLDMTSYVLALGGGYALTETLTLDMTYSAIFFHSRHISNNLQSNAVGIPDNTPGASITGNHSLFANLVITNLTYRF